MDDLMAGGHMSVNRDAELEQLSGMKVALQQARPGDPVSTSSGGNR